MSFRLIAIFVIAHVVCSFDLPNKPMKYKLDFHTSYNQFYLFDKTSSKNTAGNNFWTDVAYKDRLAIEDGEMGVGTGSYGHIRCELSILSSKSLEHDFTNYDHVVEAGIELKSGLLEVETCPTSDRVLSIKLKPGKYRVRVYSSKLASVYMDEDEGNDRYKIEMWPDDNMKKVVLKRFLIE